MRLEQVSAQLYTLREYLQTPADVAETLKKVRGIGYQSVQVSGMCPMPEDELVKLLNGEGLVCCSTHESAQRILTNPEEIVERLEKLGCRYTAFPTSHGNKLDTLDDVKALAAKLNAAGKVLYDSGKVLTYHNHHMEFRRIEGKLVLEALYEETDPRYLQGEIDTYWVQYGGCDPAAWCRRLDGRLPLLHMKDYKITTENQPDFAEIGAGNLNWKQIIEAAEDSGCEWFMIEQDTCPGDPFESLKQSFEYVKEQLVGK